MPLEYNHGDKTKLGFPVIISSFQNEKCLLGVFANFGYVLYLHHFTECARVERYSCFIHVQATIEN